MNTQCGNNNPFMYGTCFVWLGREGLRRYAFVIVAILGQESQGHCLFQPATLLNVWLPPSQSKVTLRRVVFWGSPHRTTQHFGTGCVSAALVKNRTCAHCIS